MDEHLINIAMCVLEIVNQCEEVQEDNVSDYAKKQAKISAYDEILEVLKK